MKQEKVIWAIDPYEGQLNINSAHVDFLAKWAKANHIKIEPAYVFTPSKSQANETREIEALIQEFFSKLHLETEEPVILINHSRSIGAGAQCLVNHATKYRAGLIIVSSHGRTGMPRMRFGSFAEALLTLAPVPVLFMNKNQEKTNSVHFERTLWTTDFSKHSEESFNAFLEQGKGLTSEILLFYDVGLFLEAISYATYSGAVMPSPGEVIEDQKKWANEQGALWVKKAQEHGFSARSIMGLSLTGITASILATARENKVGLVAMASHSGPLASVLLGGHSYEVLRSGEFPTWIYGPQASQKQG